MSTTLRCSVVFSLVALAAPLRAQEEPPPQVDASVQKAVVVVASGEGEGGAGGVISSFSFETSDGVAFAAPLMLNSVEPMVMFGGNAGAMNAADPSTLLNDRQIQKELELIESQVQDVQRISRQFSEKQQELTKTMFQGGSGGALSVARDPALMGQLRAAMEDLRKERTAELQKVMLPHQRERLQQLGYHMSMQKQGVAGALTNGPLADELALSDEQKERLAETAKRLEAELREEIARLREKAKQEIFAELSPVQQDKLQELIGDSFQYQEEDQKAGVLQRMRERMEAARQAKEGR